MQEGIDNLYDDLIDGQNQDTDDVSHLIPMDFEDPDLDDTEYTIEEEYRFDPNAGIGNDDDEENEENEGSQDDTHDYQPDALILSLLKAKGIDPEAVKFENEDGEIEEVPFSSLSEEERFNILNSSDADIDFGLNDDEVGTLNFLRENNVSFEDAIKYYQRQAIQEYIDSQNINGVEINQYTDEELYVLDLKSKYEDLTDDEIEIELSKQIEHPELFKKKMDKIRSEYEDLEKQQLEQAKTEQQTKDEEAYKLVETNLINAAENINDIGGLDLDVDDKNQVLTYLLQEDLNGTSAFVKSLDDPNTLFELAWFATKGKEAFSIIHDYYKNQIETVRKTTYEKAKQEFSSKPKEDGDKTTKKAVLKAPTTKVDKKEYLSINDLQID